MVDNPEEDIGDLFSGVERARNDDQAGDGPVVTPEDRPRGILSPTDREYLCGLKEYAQPQTDANRRQDIRERAVNALKDFVLLTHFLPSEEQAKLFDDLGEETDDALASMLAFAYLGMDGDRPRFEACIERGVLTAENIDTLFESAGRATDADVSIAVEYNPDIERLYEKFQEGAELTDAEIGALVREGAFDDDDLEQVVGSRGFPGVFAGADPDALE